jgi:hypothetical protein
MVPRASALLAVGRAAIARWGRMVSDRPWPWAVGSTLRSLDRILPHLDIEGSGQVPAPPAPAELPGADVRPGQLTPGA